MKIAICDDDRKITDQMMSWIHQQQPFHTIHIYHNPLDLIHQKVKYDVLFLDIDMPEMNGIEVGNEIRKYDKHTAIVYLTNMSEYRPLAFGVHAFDYIEKPATIENITKVLHEVTLYQKEKNFIPQVTFQSRQGIIHIPVDDIIYFEFLDRHVYLHGLHESYILVTNLYNVRDVMKNYHFATPHKSFCINLGHVRLVKGYDIYMTNEDVIPLSQKKSSDFRSILHRYLSLCLHEGDMP